MRIELGYGNTPQTAEIPDGNVLGVLRPNPVPAALTGDEEVRRALGQPIGAPRLSQIAVAGEKVAIVTSDITRPCPTATILPPVLDELYAAGVKPEDITLVFALGSHRRHTTQEMRKLAGERAFNEINCVDGDSEDVVRLGVSNMGTPADITRVVAEADRRICLGNIEFHYFAGYSGGAKAIMPGVSTRDAIQANHCRMIEETAVAGKIDGNPVREDIDAVLGFCPVDFIVNVVLDEHKAVLKAFAGDCIQAHREGCAFLDTLYKVEIPECADIVVVTQGGAPKDINLYQTQKALDNAKHAVKPGGTIILMGSCREGLGEKVFEQWITAADKPADLIERINRQFVLGGHKAAAIAMVLAKAGISLVSDMDPELVRSIFLTPYGHVQDALDAALAEHGPDASVIVMPYGGSTLPVAVA